MTWRETTRRLERLFPDLYACETYAFISTDRCAAQLWVELRTGGAPARPRDHDRARRVRVDTARSGRSRHALR